MLMSEVMTVESPLLWEAFIIKMSLHRTQLKTCEKREFISVFLSLLVGCWRGMNEIWRCTAVYHSLVKISLKKQVAHLLD